MTVYTCIYYMYYKSCTNKITKSKILNHRTILCIPCSHVPIIAARAWTLTKSAHDERMQKLPPQTIFGT